MKNLLLKLWNFLKQKNNLIITIIVILLLSMGAIIYFQHNKIIKLEDLYQGEVKLKDALLDTMRVYQNKEKQWVAEKLTIQETIKNLEKINGQLNDSQKELLNKIKEIEKKNDIIVAALIVTNVKIDSLLHKGETIVDTVNKKLTFRDSSRIGNKIVQYDLTVRNVLPANFNAKPTLMFNSLLFPNKQFVEFHWIKNKKMNYPVSFSVTNSNDYFKTVNIESYAIPEINHDNLHPTGWQRFGEWLGKNGKTVMFIGAGALGGAGTVWLLTK